MAQSSFDLINSSNVPVGFFAAVNANAQFAPNALQDDVIVRAKNNLLLSGGDGASDAVKVDSDNNITVPGSVTIRPPTGFGPGIDIAQVGGSGSTVPSQTGTFLGYAYNRIQVANNTTYPDSIFGQHVQLDSSAAGTGGGNATGAFHTISGSASGGSTFAIGATMYVSAETNWAGGTASAPDGAVYAGSFYARMGGPNPVHLLNLTGMEINPEAGGHTSSTVAYKSGIQIAALQNDLYQGTHYDGAISISAIFGASAGWRNGLLFSDANGQQPMAATGTLIKTQGSATITGGIDLTSYTFTGNVFASTNFAIDGAGQVSGFRFNNVTIRTPASPATLTIAATKEFTASNTLTLTGIDGSTIAFGTGGTVSYLGASQTFSGKNTFSGQINDGVSVLSGLAGQPGGLSVGRTGVDGYLVAIGYAGGYNAISAQGDVILRGASRLLLDGSNGAINALVIDSTNKVTFPGNVGFNGTTAIARPTVTGSRGGNDALASLLTALASYGLIIDNSGV